MHMPRRALLSLPLAAVAGACSALGAAFKYRLAYRFRVDGQLREASGVVENRWRDNRTIFGAGPGPAFICETWGEAVPIDLGGSRGLIFALMVRIPDDPNYHWAMPRRMLEARVPQEQRDQARDGEIYRLMAQVRGELAIPNTDLPTFVRFRDLADARTVERVDPINPSTRDTDASFVGASIEITGAPVTRRINDLLPWLRSTDNFLSGARSGAGGRESFFASLTKPMFEREGF